MPEITPIVDRFELINVLRNAMNEVLGGKLVFAEYLYAEIDADFDE